MMPKMKKPKFNSTAIKKGGFISLLPTVLIGCASSGVPIDRDIDLVTAPSVQVALAAHQPSPLVPSQLFTADMVVTIDHKGNFGRIDTSEQQQVFAWQADGRLVFKSTGVYKTPDGSISVLTSNSSSLCGLVPILNESSTKNDSRLTTVAPVGGLFVPLGFSSKSHIASRERLVRFSTSAANLCKPTPGASFTYQAIREEQRKVENSVHSSNKLHTHSESVSCKIGSVEQSARALNPSLAGNYLSVSCSYSDPSKPTRKSEFAYLLASGIYLPVSVQLNEYQTNTTRYTAFRYK